MDHNVLVYGVRIWSKKLCYWFRDIYLFDRKSEDDDNKKKWSFNLYFKHKTIQQNERNIIHDYDVVCNK